MKLIFISGAAADHRYQVDRDITIGRDISNDIVIPDPSISLVHAQIHSEQGKFFIKDLGSTNGIKLNGEKIISTRLHDGDGLSIGHNHIRVEIPEEEALPTVVSYPEETPPATIMDHEIHNDHSQNDEIEDLSGNISGSVSYFMKRRIAKGGMGAIYEGEQLGAEGFIKKVAIKTILPSFAQKESFVSSFVGEARLVANLIHQNIVQIHHLGRHEKGYFISMEYIDGINLSHFIHLHKKNNVRVPIDIAVFIISRICRGLAYAHSRQDENGNSLGLVHRDVSPNNIMINREGEVKLTDFGVAKAAQFMEDDEDYLVGSVEYMSPEQAECLQVDQRSDIFSVGLVFFELLTGFRIFKCKDNNIDATVELVIEARVPDPGKLRSDIPPEILICLNRCLEKLPDNRYQNADELTYDLEHAIYSKGYGPTISKMADYLKSLEQLNAMQQPHDTP